MATVAPVFRAGSTAIITGGASGIGLSLARRCRARGMKVLVADWDEQLLQQLDTDKDPDLLAFKMDVSQLDDWVALKRKVDEELCGISPSPYPPGF